MGFLSNLIRRTAEDWTYLELAPDQVPNRVSRDPIAADAAYVTVTLRSMRIVDVRKGLKRFYGAVHSWCSLPHEGDSRAEFQVVTTPSELKDADAEHLDRVIQADRVLLGSVPYRGGNLDLELGLFSVVSSELVGPYLEVLESMASAAGVSFVSVAKPFIAPLTRGIDLLTGTSGNASLEIGLAKEWEPTTGYYAILRAPRGTIRQDDVAIAADQRLVRANGEAIQDYPYVVFTIEASRERATWFEIPDLKQAYDALIAEVRRGRVEDAEAAYAVFRRAALTSPDLLFDDAVAIADKVQERVKQTLGPVQTAAAKPADMPPLAALSPYG